MPKKPEGKSGVDYYYYFNSYVEAINKEINLSNQQNFWFQGKKKREDGATSFVNQIVGIDELYKVPKYMAEICGFDHPEQFTGHSFRRTATTIMADSGATGQQLRNKLNHKSEQGNFKRHLFKTLTISASN